MNLEQLKDEELDSIFVGEAITLTAVMAVLVVGIIAVVAYRLLKSGKGNVKLPGGYQFEWK